MFMTGYTVLDIGMVFTVVHVISIPVTYLIGRLFDRIPIRHGLVLIDALEGTSSILFGLAYGPIAPLMLFMGLIVNEIASMFYPLYQAAERILYPEDKMEKIFAWHIRLPEISQLIGFLVLGYVFGYIFTTPRDYRLGFIVIGLSSSVTIVYLLTYLPKLDVEERIGAEKFRFRVDTEFKLILVIEALITLAWALAPEMVLINYVVNVLGLTFFEVMVVEATVCMAAILASYLSEQIEPRHRFKAIATGYLLISLWALTMTLNPPFTATIAAYFIARFGDVLAFPFYRSWIFSKIPKEKASSLLATLSSYRKLILLTTPTIAGLLAYIKPTLPYLTSLTLFTTASLLLTIYHKLSKKTLSKFHV